MPDPTPVSPVVLITIDHAVAAIARRIADDAASLDPVDLRELGVAAWYAACARDNLTPRAAPIEQQNLPSDVPPMV